MAGMGIGASVGRKEDERFLRGRGQYVGDFRIPGTREVAFVRSPVAHARLRTVTIPGKHKNAVFTADDLTSVKPIKAATSIGGFKYSREPILAAGKVRFVGEIIAACLGRSRAEAEDIAASVQLEFEELTAVVDMLEARKVAAPLVHDDWNDNVFVTFAADTGIEAVASTAAIKVTRKIRTPRQCMLPLEGRGVVAWWDDRLRYLTVITATQMPHIVQTGLAECLGLSDGAVRVISPDVGGGFGYKGLLCREEVVLGWLALHFGHPLRWLEDCREQLSANANCREHHYVISAYANAEGRLLGIDCEASVDAGAYSVYPTSAALEAGMIPSLLPGPYDFSAYRCSAAAVATNKCPILPYRGVARSGGVTFREVARAWYFEPQHLAPDVDPGGLEVTAGYRAGRDSGTFSYAVHAAVVAVDPETGLIQILDYVVVEDGGVLVNPMIVDGQIRGGTAQGIGTCIYEAMPFDACGQPLAGTLADYLLPGASEIPEIRVLHMETPSPYTLIRCQRHRGGRRGRAACGDRVGRQ
jgi:CO/xanthine dehydrogenase Mo-binding subunit